MTVEVGGVRCSELVLGGAQLDLLRAVFVEGPFAVAFGSGPGCAGEWAVTAVQGRQGRFEVMAVDHGEDGGAVGAGEVPPCTRQVGCGGVARCSVLDGDAAFMDSGVVALAQQHQVAQVGGAACVPGDNVVDLQVSGPVAAREGAVTVAYGQGTSLCAGAEASGAAHCEGFAVEAGDHGVDLGVAGESARGLGFHAAMAAYPASCPTSRLWRSRGNVGGVADEVAGRHLDNHHGPVLATAVLGLGVQIVLGDLDQTIDTGTPCSRVRSSSLLVRLTDVADLWRRLVVRRCRRLQRRDHRCALFWGEHCAELHTAVVAVVPADPRPRFPLHLTAGTRPVGTHGPGELGCGCVARQLQQPVLVMVVDQPGQLAHLGVRQLGRLERGCRTRHPT